MHETKYIETLGRYHIKAPRSQFVSDAQDVGPAAQQIGFPVAVKLVSPQFSHKTEVGGVKINIGSAEDANAAAHDMKAHALKIDAAAKIDGFLVQEMVNGIELILGARTDPLYGPLLIVGAGGIFVEMLKDIAIRLLPISRLNARAILDELKIKPLLDGYRGSVPIDVDAVIDVMCGLSDFYLNYRHLLDDIEINPLIVRPKGNAPCAVDIRLVKKDV